MNYRFRFKTEEEFISEYGKNWRHNLGYYCFSNMMTGLLGTTIEEVCMINCIQMMTGLRDMFMLKYNGRYFYITKGMIKYEEFI